MTVSNYSYHVEEFDLNLLVMHEISRFFVTILIFCFSLVVFVL